MLASALSGIGSSLIGGLVGQAGVKSQNIANARQAQLNREFQANQSSTAHQRQVADLRKAGLNPILSATGGSGASSSPGAQAQMQNELEPMANSARNAAHQAAQIKLLNAQADKTSNEADITEPKAKVMNQASTLIDKIVPATNTAKDYLGNIGRKAGSAAYDIFNPQGTVTPATKHKPIIVDKSSSKKTPPSKIQNIATLNSPKKIKYMLKNGYKWNTKQLRWIKK